jgi:hypothetical protein
MTRKQTLRAFALAIPAAAVLALGSVSPASAAKGSNSSKFTNGAKLTANVWIATVADWGGCADFATSAVISGGHKPKKGTDWVKNYTKFDAWGFDASLKAFGQSGDPVSHSWTNSNGSRGSYLDGSICTNWRTVGLVGTTTASAHYNGQTKSVTAST